MWLYWCLLSTIISGFIPIALKALIKRKKEENRPGKTSQSPGSVIFFLQNQ